MATTNFKSRLLVAKQKRKDASHDAMLLKNRLALLKAEEEKAWKKIQQTKGRANELIKQRQANAIQAEEKRQLAAQLEQESTVLHKRKALQQASTISVRKGPSSNKSKEVQLIKEEKQQWRKEIEKSRRKDMEEAIKKKEAVQRHEEQLKQKKALQAAEKERANRARAEKRIKEEERIARKKQLQVEEMEKKEMELIQRLRKTQELQKKAYDELENALGGAS